MPRYEYSAGTSNKFWEIQLSGSSFTTTYGRIGTDGKSTTKEFDSPAKAKQECEKLIAQKVKKGYELVDAGGTTKKKATKKKATKKKTTKKKTPASEVASGASVSGSGGPRYELVDGRSSKFWEIKLEGTSVVTTYGRIGTNGKSTTKKMPSRSWARAEHDKLVAAKLKKGYVLVDPGAGAAGASTSQQASNPELEAALLEDPTNEEAYLVYADWLQTQGDARGELITIQHSLSKEDPKSAAAKRLRKAEAALLEQHAEHFLPAGFGQLVAKERPKKKDWRHYMLETGYSDAAWYCGFLKSARIARTYDDEESGAPTIEEAVDELLAHPSARFLQELTIGALGIGDEYNYQRVVSAIVAARPASLRALTLARFMVEDSELSWSLLGDVSGLYKALPRLERLHLRGGSMTLGKIDLPNLKSFRVETGGLDLGCIKSIRSARWPQLESLHVYLGDEDYGAGGDLKSIKPILDGSGLGKLRHLGLMNAEFTDAICEALSRAKVLKQLETLDLTMGTMSDEGAAALAAGKKALEHLKRLDVSDNFLTKRGIDLLQGICAEVVTGKQKEPYDWDEDGRYVSVGE